MNQRRRASSRMVFRRDEIGKVPSSGNPATKMTMLMFTSQRYTRSSDAKTAVLHPSIPSPARRIGEKCIDLVRRMVIFDDCISGEVLSDTRRTYYNH